jgi:hypothetical protein
MSTEEHRSPAALNRVLAAGTDGPRWRALLMLVSTVVNASIYFATAGGDFYHNI